MSSLTTCARKVGTALDPKDKAAVMARAREFRGTGLGATEAAIKAARDLIGELRAQLPAETKPQAAAPKQMANAGAKHPATVMGSRLLAVVSKRLGGLDPAWLAEFSTRAETKRMGKDGRPIVQWRNPMVTGIGKLFRQGGTQDLQRIAEVLEEEGYLAPGSVEANYKEAGEAAKTMIQRALQKGEVQTLDEQQAEIEAGQEADRQAYYAELDAEAAREAEAERQAIIEANDLDRIDLLPDDDIPWDLDMPSTASIEQTAAFLGITVEELQNEGLQGTVRQDEPTQAGAGQEDRIAAAQGPQPPPEAGGAAQGQGSEQGLTLEAQTLADLKAKADREQAAAAADKAEQKRLADKAKADAKRNEFTLTGSDRPADVAAAAGQGGLFDGPSEPAAAPPTKPAGANNTVFTQSDAEKARALLRKKLGQFNSGIDPEMLQAGITLAGYHIEAGARTFAKFVRAMVDDLGEAVRPYLKSWYAAVSFDPRAAAFTGDMTPVAEVATIDVDAITTESSDVPSTDAGMERDRADGAGAPRAVGDAVPADAGGTAAGPAAARIQPGEGGRGRANDPGILAGGAVPAGVGGDQRVPGADRAGLPEEFPAGSERPGRGDDARDGGIPPQHVTAGDVAKDAGAGLPNESRLAAQRAAERIPVVPGDAENILATLPYLLSGQQEDVGKAEARFAQPDGYGMLFTNGTGTGKTFTGLGVIKRFARQGKTNTLIVVPDDKIMADWVNSAKALDLTVTPLKSTKDAGSGITITTYANLGDNAAVAGRDWDLVVPDEAHSLSQGKDGSPTKVLDVLRAITHHPRGAYTRYSLLNAADIERLSDLTARITGNVKIMNNPDTMDEMLVSLRAENVKLEAQQSALVNKLDAARKAVEQDVKARQGARRTRVLMLSATPFAYEKSVDLAEGYLFDYTDGYPYEKTGSRPYNQPDPHDYFFMTHFGYRMRVNKLTEPDDPKLDRGLLQRQFNGWLKKQGVLSQRSLDVAADYDRRFVLVDSAVGNRIDEALAWVSERSRKEAEGNRERKRGTEDGGFASLESALRDQLYGSDGYLVRRYLLEAIKAKEIIPHVREHMAMGRKVVVFHDFNKGGSRNPFALTEVPQEIIDAGIGLEGASGDAARKAQQYNEALAEFKREYPDLTGGELLRDLISPIERFRREFPGVLLVNGLEKKRDLLARYRLFNDDATGPQVMLVQSEKNKGWSGHDTTGKHQRVLFNLGLPTKPTMAIQQEGRIYRTGQVSDALFRYLNTGTNWERWAFAQTIAQRASVADNLGSGESARALRDAFISGFEESGDFRAGHEGEGKGGKERDRIVDTATTDFDRAKSFYRGTQKKTSRTKAEEGADYFATPEPLGLKMVQWLDLRGGESSLEPSGGHGAIARWLPDNVDRTAIEPSMTLRSRMALVFEGKIVPTSFEDFHIVNKFDGVGMNPPFGTAGRLAIEHLAKATQHLRDGGRVAAIIPTGPAADAKFDKWLYALDDKGKPSHPDLHLVADIRLPAVTFERAGTAVSTRVVIIDKGKDAPQTIHRDLSDITSIEELFNRIEDMEVPKRLKAEAAAPDPAARPQPAADARAQVQADKAAAQEDGEQIAQRLGLQVIEHVTKGGAGKTLRGVLRPDLKPAQAQEVDAYTFKKDGAQFIRLEHMAEMVRKHPPPGTVAAEERAVYAVNEPTGTDVPLDLFPESLQGLQALPAEPRAGRRGRSGSAAAGDVQPAAAVPAKPNTFAEREDPQFPGLYHYSTQLVQVGQRELPVAKVENWQQAASALAAMGRYAVEHFDVLITDANGKPLAVVGAFKGAQAQAPVYPSTVLAEALRIKGAAKAWGVHNHPSGDASLSRADEHLSNTLAQAFGPSTVDWMGIAAIGGDKFSAFDGVRPYYDSLITGPTKATVPVVERTITPGNKDMPKLENPPTARKVAGTIAAGRSGVLFTDVQHRVTAFVPLESAHAKELRKDGRFDRLINAASNAGAGAAVIVNQAEVYDARTLENIASALRLADIRVLDAVDPVRGTSLAQQGLEPRGNVPVLSQSPAMKRGTGPGADIATLKPHIDAIAAKLQGLRAPVQVVSTVFDLPGDIVAALRSMNAMGTTRGLRMPDGRVFLVADKLRDQAEAEFVLFHELFGHEGIRALLDEAAYARELTKLKLANPALASEANQWFASYGADQIAARVERGMSEPEARKVVRLLAIEEALSDRAGKNEPLKGWQAFMAAIQKALRAVGAEGLANWLESRTQAETMALLNAARKAITEGVAHVTRETAASAPVLNRRADTMAPAVAVLRDETGAPTEFVGPRVVLAYPQETERFEVIPEPGQKILSYAIMPAEGFDSLGFVELLVENGRPVSLLDIEVQPYKRQAGTGAAVIETLLAADPKAELHISNIVESARGFWERMGVPQQNRAHGEAYDGILDWNTFAQAQDERAAQSLGRRSAARAAEPDRGGQGPDRRGPRDAQGDGSGQEDLPALSRVAAAAQAQPAAAPAPASDLSWRDPTGRLQFAPGALLYRLLGRAATPTLSKLALRAASPELKRQLREMKLDVQRAMDTAVAVAKEGKALSEDERAMVSDIIERELAAGTVPPAHAVRMAGVMNAAMGQQSAELVQLGMLTQETVDRWQGQYLPRFYESKMRKKASDAWADAVAKLFKRTSVMKGIQGNRLKARGLWETIPVHEIPNWLQMGWEVRDPNYRPGIDAEVQVWRDYTRQEREDMGEVRDSVFRFVMGYMQTQRDIALGRMLESMANDPASSSRLPNDAAGWVRVPDTTVPDTGAKRYGKLAGRYVPADTLSHLSHIEEVHNETLQMYRRALSVWKMGKTVLNPVSHVNNVVSNLTMAHFAGVSYWQGHKYAAAIRDFVRGSASLRQARDAGLFLGTMTDAELMQELPPELRDLAEKADSKTLRSAKFAFDLMTFFLRKPASKAYQAEDTFFRYLLWKDGVDRGMDPGDAVDWAQKFIFNYDDLPKGARRIRDFAIPFFSYTYKFIPAALETALTHPLRFAAPAAVLYAANAAMYAIASGDDGEDWYERISKYLTDDERRKRADEKKAFEAQHLAPWMKGNTALGTPKAMRLGMDEVTGLPLFIDVSRLIPGGDIFDVSPNVKGGIPWLQPFTPSNPILTTLTAMFGNRDLWTGKDLVDRNDDAGEAAQKRLGWIYKQVTPAATIGNYHWDKILQAASYANGGSLPLPQVIDDLYPPIGRDLMPVQPKYAAMQTLGLKVRPLDLDRSAELEKVDIRKDIQSIDTEMRSLRRLNGKGAVKNGTLDRAQDKAEEKKERLRQGLTVDGNAR